MIRKLLLISTVATTLLLTFLVPSYAEKTSTSLELQNNKRTITYLYSRPMLENMYRLGLAQDRKFGLQLNCKTQYNVKPLGSSVFSPIDFPDDKQHPTMGLWHSRYALERCGDSKIYNAIFLFGNNGEPPIPRAYYPGSTMADPLLIKDAMVTATVSGLLKAKLKDCRDVDVFDMRVIESPHDIVEGDKRLKGVWSERWTFLTCGQLIDTDIRFIPDTNGGGTTFTTSITPKTPDTAVKH